MRELAVLVFAALVAWFVWWLLGRGSAPPPPTTSGPPPTTTGPLPTVRPGEIWWAYVPFRDGYDGKHRPCLVLTVHPRQLGVLKITSQDKSHRRDHLQIPTAGWDRSADHDSYLDVSAPIAVGWHALDRRAGVVDANTWQYVRQLHRTGSSGSPAYPGIAPFGHGRTGRAPAVRIGATVLAFFLVLCFGLTCLVGNYIGSDTATSSAVTTDGWSPPPVSGRTPRWP